MSDPEVFDRVSSVLTASTDNFIELLKLSGLDPKTDLRGTDLTDCDFSDCDLTGCDFSGADLSRSTFDRAFIMGACFTGANMQDCDLTTAADWTAPKP